MRSYRRAGFAVAATILAMLVVGAVVTGGFYVASHQAGSSGTGSHDEEAVYIAETGLNAALEQITPAQLGAIEYHGSWQGAATDVTPGSTVLGNYVINITRVADALFLVRSAGTTAAPARSERATHTLASVVRLRTARFDHQAAALVHGDLRLGRASVIEATDTHPESWLAERCTATTSSAALIAHPGARVLAADGHINGAVRRLALNDQDFQTFGDFTHDELVRMKDRTVRGTVTPQSSTITETQACNVRDDRNWGSTNSAHPCYNYFPVIHAPGDLHIRSNSEGQGLLLVDGDLTISGGFSFYGVVIVKGHMRTRDSGGRVFGSSFLTENSSDPGRHLLLQYSSCAIDRTLRNNPKLARVVPIAHRSWLDISAIEQGK